MKSSTVVGEHRIEIIETGVLSSSSTHETQADGAKIFTYEGRNLKIKLENEVLAVNGKGYVIPKKDDSIKIQDNYVEINGQPAEPEEETSRGKLGSRPEASVRGSSGSANMKGRSSSLL